MGRHSRKGPAPAGRPPGAAPAAPPAAEQQAPYGQERGREPYAYGQDGYGQDGYGQDGYGQDGYGQHQPYEQSHGQQYRQYEQYEQYEQYGEFAYEEHASSGGHAAYGERHPQYDRPAGHPEQREPGGGWGAGPGTVYGDWQGLPGGGAESARAPRSGAETVLPGSGPAADASDGPASTGPQRRVPAPRGDDAEETQAGASGTGRGRKALTYTGMAAAAVTTVLAVVVAGHMSADADGKSASPRAAGAAGDRALPGQSAASRSDGRAVPQAPPEAPAPAPELTYDQKMAQQLPIDEKLKGPGTFETVPGVAAAPGKGDVVRYRVDVETGLGLDAQLFAEAVHRTLNDDRSWAHGGRKTFERVPGGSADFVITLASPGTTGVWCAKSGLDTTIENVSCDSANTDRVMINAYRWAQGSPTYGAEQMFAYRQMLINHEVGHRLGHGHVNCQTPGAPAPIMQQQTKSLEINGVRCKPNPWVFPGN
ncbi:MULTISPECIES: DUF3152 domain-containing protein [Streptomyces]|uniref:DUF3152 domain-containing protein n=1 Tax=Streptomyces TaxID=1883 RepID=UPI00167BD0F0|nr:MULTISPECIES: DUF3152 domain-containing protein [Streptomyces]MBD3576623.1 DUF3152 domain-containing protein [Streptomyces sp. KD18]GGT06405.1 hypothetical protein GCM10010286_34620 [Streptomyces toxytricini]